MTLETTLKIIGWGMVLIPVALYIIVSVHMFRGLMGDDDMVTAVVFLCLAFFLIGAGMLSMIYFTTLII